MTITKEQKDLLRAVSRRQIARAREMLDRGVNPDFPDFSETTPLHEAVKTNHLPLVKLLVQAGASVDLRNNEGDTPLDLAKYIQASPGIIRCLNDDNSIPKKHAKKKKSAKKTSSAKQAGRSVKKSGLPDTESEKPSFSIETLPEIFKAEKWVEHVNEMQKLWDKVPKRLKAGFDFAAALTKARQETLKKGAPAKIVLKKAPRPDSRL